MTTSPSSPSDEAEPMPWCDSCSEYHAPTALASGRCPVCGGAVDDERGPGGAETVGASAPWHFWVVVALLALYLGWRVIAFVIWAVR